MLTEKEKLIQDRADVEWVISTPQGRRFMWRLLSICGIYRDIEGSGDEMCKQIGRRQIGLNIMGIISDASEDRLFEMMREAKTRSVEEKLNYERSNRKHRIDSYIDVESSGELPEFVSDGPDF